MTEECTLNDYIVKNGI